MNYGSSLVPQTAIVKSTLSDRCDETESIKSQFVSQDGRFCKFKPFIVKSGLLIAECIQTLTNVKDSKSVSVK